MHVIQLILPATMYNASLSSGTQKTVICHKCSVTQGLRHIKTLVEKIFQELRDYLPVAGQRPVLKIGLSLEYVGSEQSRSAELTFYGQLSSFYILPNAFPI